MRTVSDRDASMLDQLAADPERALVEIVPEWMA
jgi:hypothetical protein